MRLNISWLVGCAVIFAPLVKLAAASDRAALRGYRALQGVSQQGVGGACTARSDPTHCNSSPTAECYWDQADNRCESRATGGAGCDVAAGDQIKCSSLANCFWDANDRRCEVKKGQ